MKHWQPAPSAAHFILVEAERYRHLARRTRDPQMAAHWNRVVQQYEDLARRYDEYQRELQS